MGRSRERDSPAVGRIPALLLLDSLTRLPAESGRRERSRLLVPAEHSSAAGAPIIEQYREGRPGRGSGRSPVARCRATCRSRPRKRRAWTGEKAYP